MMHRFLLSALCIIIVTGAAQAAEKIGVVGALTGSATATVDGAKRSLKVGDPIHREDMLTTGAGSKMQVMLNDQSSITLNPNSKLKVSEFAFDENANDGSIKMDALKGAFRFIGGAVSKKREAKIKTPVSSIGIRGSIGDTFIAANGATDAVFASGTQMSMTNANGDTTTTFDFGTGFSMQTPEDSPQPMNVNQVIQRTNSFVAPTPRTDGSGTGDNNAASNNDGGDTPPAANNGNDGGDGSANANGGEDSGDGNVQNNAQNNEQNPPQQNNADNGDDNAKTFGRFAQDGGDNAPVPKASNNNANGSAGNATANNNRTAGQQRSGAATENQRVNTVNNLSGDDQRAFNDPDSVRNTIQSAIDRGADASGNTTAPRFRGFMVELDYDDTSASESVDTQRITELRNFIRNTASNQFEGEELIRNSITPGEIGTTSNIDFPLPNGGTAFTNLTPGSDILEIQGDAYKGFVFRSPSKLTSYYLFRQVGTNAVGNSFTPISGPDIGDEIKLIIGQEILASERASVLNATVEQSRARNTGDISYYGFLPNLNNHTLADAGVPTPGHDGVGIFNYGYIDVNPGATDETSFAELSPANGHFGVAVNWEKLQFFSGFVRWGNEGGNPNESSDTVAFGQINTGDSANFFDGNAYTTVVAPGDVEEHVLDSNYSTAFKDNNNVLESVVLGGQDAGDATLDGAIIQPGFLLDTSGSNGAPLKDNTNTQTAGTTTYHGFTAGFHNRDKNNVLADQGFTTLHNTNADSLTITTDSSNNSTAATIELDDGAGANYTYDFGANSNASNGDSVFLSDDLYAAELGKAARSGAAHTSPDYDIDDVSHNQGFIANAEAINNLTTSCASCDYVHWGVWAVSTDLHAGGVGPADNLDAAQLTPYVAGTVTTAAQLDDVIANRGAATLYTYNGAIVGNVHNTTGDSFQQRQGTFSVDIDLLNREIENFNGNLGSITMTSTNQAAVAASGSFAGFNALALTLDSGGNTGSGSLAGALFGPNAENIGGNFQGSVAVTTENVSGVFLGNR